MVGWIKLYRELLDKAVWKKSTAEQKSVLITILLLANHRANEWEWQGKRFIVHPGQFITSLDSLATEAGVSVRSVRTAIARFEKYDFLTNESTKTGRLITVINWGVYQGGDDEDDKVADNALANRRQRPDKDLTTNKNDNNNKYICSFDSFWTAYPKKQGKSDAIKAWAKLNPDSDLTGKILDAVGRFKLTDAWTKDGGQYIPLPATFIRGKRWEDELLTASLPPPVDPYADMVF